MKKWILMCFVAITAVSVAAQCPMCKTALESGRNKTKNTVGNGINSGILFLLTAPYVMIGAVGFVWYKNRMKK